MQPTYFRQSIFDLLKFVLKHGCQALDIPLLVSIALSPFEVINELAMKTLAKMADPEILNFDIAL
jgi:hypothetical protein